MNDLHFYTELQPLKVAVAELFRDDYFHNVPASWHIIISDVKRSTEAVIMGKHNDVNLAAAGSLIAALNVAKKHKIDVPFFFGGDGSTLLVPEELLAETLGALTAHNLNVRKNFGLDMHIGSLSVKALCEESRSVRLAKLEVDSAFSKAVVIGDGLHYAEQKIKQSQRDETDTLLQNTVLNLAGLECRWDKVKPLVEEAENVCYLIEAVEPLKQLALYAEVLQTIELIYGDSLSRNPLSPETLKPLISLRKLKREMLVKFGNWKPVYLFEHFLRTIFGKFYFKYDWSISGLRGKEYLRQLVAHADTLTVDGRINTIICATKEKHGLFLHYLSQKEKEGLLIYGHHTSKESIVTCYIENRKARHIHFVDGADGGYTEAAREFKAKVHQTVSMVFTHENP